MKPIITLFLFTACIFSSPAFSQGDPTSDTLEIDGKIFVKVDEEASYPGGIAEWRSFLERTVDPMVPVNNGAPAGFYTVIVQFVVDKDGSVSDIKALTNFGYGMEQEVIRIMKQAGLWKPAMLNGKAIKAYRKQPVTFQVTIDELEILTEIPFVLFTKTDNALTVKVKKVKQQDIQLTTTHGSITNMGNGRYVAKVSKPGRVIIRVYDTKKDKEIGAMSFEVREKAE